MDSGVKPGQALPRTNWTSSPTVRRLCVRSSSSGSSACSGSACPADVRSVAPLLSPAVESGLRARSVCAETAEWLRGHVAVRASPLWDPCRSGRGRVEVQAFALAQDVVQDVHRPWRHGNLELPEEGRGGGRGAVGQRGVERLQLGFTMPFVGALFTIVLQLHNETTSSVMNARTATSTTTTTGAMHEASRRPLHYSQLRH